MILPSGVTQSIDENLVDISSAWLWSTATVYSDETYSQILTQPISVEAGTLPSLRFADAATTIEIRQTADPMSLVLWSGDATLLPDPIAPPSPSVLIKSAGVADPVPPMFTDLGSGSFSVDGCNVNLYATPNYIGTIDTYAVAGGTFTLTSGFERYLCIRYNSGAPEYYLETDNASITGSDIIAVYVMWLAPTGIAGALEIHSVSLDSRGIGLPNKVADMMTRTQPYMLTYGQSLTLGETSTPTPRTVLIAGAVVYAGVDPINVLALNSSVAGNRLTRVNHAAGNWTYTNTTTYDNSNYDNGTNLVPMGSNRYGVRWYYRSIGDDIQAFYTCSGNYSNVADAYAESVPTGLPILLQDHCVLVGRMIIQQGLNTAVAVQNVATTSFTNTATANHNSLNGLQGNGSDYYHLDQFQYADIVNRNTKWVNLDGSNSPMSGALSAPNFIGYNPGGGNGSGLQTLGAVGWYQQSRVANERWWDVIFDVVSGEFRIRAVDDSGSTTTTPFAITRTGSTATSIKTSVPVVSSVQASSSFQGPYGFAVNSPNQAAVSLYSAVSTDVRDRNFVISVNGGTVNLGYVDPGTGVMGTILQASVVAGTPQQTRINQDLIVGGGYGTVTAFSFVKPGGTSSQFLKADGSVDSNSYALASSLGSYVLKAGDTMTGDLTINKTAGSASFFLQSAGTGMESNISWTSPGAIWLMGQRNGISGVPNTALTLWGPAGGGGGTAYWYQSTTLFKVNTAATVAGSFTASSGITCSGWLVLPEMTIKTYTTATYGAIYGASVTSSASNYSVLIAKDGSSAYLNGTSGCGLDVNNVDIVKATATGAAITGRLTVSSYPVFFGATLQAWGAGRNATTLGGTISMEQVNSSGDYWIVHNNCYFDGTNNRSISATQVCSQIALTPSGQFNFDSFANNGANGIVTVVTKASIDTNGNFTTAGSLKYNGGIWQDYATNNTYSMLYSNSVTPSGTNYSFGFKKDFTNSYVNASSAVNLNINDSPMLIVTSALLTSNSTSVLFNGDTATRTITSIKGASDSIGAGSFLQLTNSYTSPTLGCVLQLGASNTLDFWSYTTAGGWVGPKLRVYPTGELQISGSLQSGYGVAFINSGAGTYNRTVMFADSTGVVLERPRATDSIGGTINPFFVGQRGGGTYAFEVGTSTTYNRQPLNVTNFVYAGSSAQAAMGSWISAPASYAVWCHSAFAANGQAYALLQSNAGATYINSASGQAIGFQISNITVGNFTGSVFRAGDGTNVGACIHPWAGGNTVACFSHTAYTGAASSFSIAQNSAGGTTVNSVSGQVTYLTINNDANYATTWDGEWLQAGTVSTRGRFRSVYSGTAATYVGNWPANNWWGIGSDGATTGTAGVLQIGQCSSVGVFSGSGVKVNVLGKLEAKQVSTATGGVICGLAAMDTALGGATDGAWFGVTGANASGMVKGMMVGTTSPYTTVGNTNGVYLQAGTGTNCLYAGTTAVQVLVPFYPNAPAVVTTSTYTLPVLAVGQMLIVMFNIISCTVSTSSTQSCSVRDNAGNFTTVASSSTLPSAYGGTSGQRALIVIGNSSSSVCVIS